MTLLAKFRKLLKRNDGATAVEYGLIAAGIALVILPAVQLMGTRLHDTLENVATQVAGGDGGDLEACGDPDSCLPPPPPLPPAD